MLWAAPLGPRSGCQGCTPSLPATCSSTPRAARRPTAHPPLLTPAPPPRHCNATQLGLELTLALRALSYGSPQEALDDLAAFYNGATNLATLPLKAVEGFQAKASGGGDAGGAGATQRRVQGDA